jgi:SAM-dependent methyltransferase
MWKEAIFKPQLCDRAGHPFRLRGYRSIPGGWVSGAISELEKGNEMWQGSEFQGRVRDLFSTTGVETGILEMKLRQFLKKHSIPKEAIVMDAGCADGRVTHLLLNAGMQRIVSTDLDQGNVSRMINSLDPDQRTKVLAIVDDFNNLPISDTTIDVLFAAGLLAELPDFQTALRSALRTLKPGGLLFYFDPVLEHALIYSLVRRDLDEFLRIAKTSTRARMWDQKDRRYHVYLAAELERQFQANPEVEIILRDGINLLPSLIFGGILQEETVSPERKQELRDAIQSLSDKNLQVYRQVIYVCRKTGRRSD